MVSLGRQAERQPRSPLQAESLLLGLVLLFATIALYAPVNHYPFIDIDDNRYVTENPRVTGVFDFATVKWAFTHPFVELYDPLTFFSHNLDVQLFQMNAGGHHDVNVLLHALSAVLVFWVLKRATGFTGRSFMVAALFALHPIQVENVAWISERKTVLSSVFFFLALGAYRWYARSPKLRRMALVAFLFGLGLLAKPQVITFPFVLLLWDYWPLRRMFSTEADSSTALAPGLFPPRSWFALVKEKIPLFLIAVGDAGLTIVGEHRSSLEGEQYTLTIRLGNAILSYARYMGKAFWPDRLALMYLHAGYALPWRQVWLSGLLLAGVSALVIAGWRHRYLTVGWLWFLGMLVPTIGLVQVDVSAMADRYAYLPVVGLFLMVCWAVAEWWERRSLPRSVLAMTSLAVSLLLCVQTHRQVGYWRDRTTLWTHTLEVTHRNWVAEMRLAAVLYQQGQKEEALERLYRADQDRPRDAGILEDLAILEHERGNLSQAIPLYEEVLAISKDEGVRAQVLINLGHAYNDLGDYDRARECYEASRRRTPVARPAIDWGGEWWHDIGPAIRQYFR